LPQQELFVAQDLVMSEISLTLVLQIKTSKIINDMAKVQQKSEKITAFGGIFFVFDKFDRILSSVIDSHLGLRSTQTGYQYSEITRAVFSVFCCGGDGNHGDRFLIPAILGI